MEGGEECDDVQMNSVASSKYVTPIKRNKRVRFSCEKNEIIDENGPKSRNSKEHGQNFSGSQNS